MAGILILLGIAALNALAYRHAYSMTHFASGPARTASPEALSPLARLGVLIGGVTLNRPVNSTDPGALGLAFRTLTIITQDGLRLEAWHIPHGAEARGTAFLFHGYGSCKAGMLPEARFFHNAGFDVVLLDFRGSGGSEGNVTSIGYSEALDVKALLAAPELAAVPRPVILYGTSMGAAAVLRAMACEGVAADALILQSPFDTLLNTVKNRFRSMGVPAFPSAHLLTFWGGRQLGYGGFAHNPADYAAAVRCPTLVLHGENDPRVSTAEVTAVKNAVAGPATMHIFRGRGHEPYAQAVPAEYDSVVSAWLAGLRR